MIPQCISLLALSHLSIKYFRSPSTQTNKTVKIKATIENKPIAKLGEIITIGIKINKNKDKKLMQGKICSLAILGVLAILSS